LFKGALEKDKPVSHAVFGLFDGFLAFRSSKNPQIWVKSRPINGFGDKCKNKMDDRVLVPGKVAQRHQFVSQRKFGAITGLSTLQNGRSAALSEADEFLPKAKIQVAFRPARIADSDKLIDCIAGG
jgi:hypothetical protein